MKKEDILAEKILALEQEFVYWLRKPVKSQAEVQQKVQQKEDARLRLAEALGEAAKELVNDLRSVGVDVETVWDLVNTSSSYKPAIPVLVEHLSRPYHKRIKEGIVRSLAVKEAKGIACRAIIDEYHKAPRDDFHYRWAFGVPMAVVVTPEYMDDLIAIVLDEGNGESRRMFVRALGKIKSPEAKEALQRLLNDESEIIRKEAEKALKKFK